MPRRTISLESLPRAALALLLFAPLGCASAGLHAEPPEGGRASLIDPPSRNVAESGGAVSDATPGAARVIDDPEAVAVPIEGSDLMRGRATLKVKAPIERVRAAVLDFGHYAEFMPHYKASRVLGRTPGGGREVYMQIEALFGAVTMWAQVEFLKPTVVGETETYESRFEKGNVKDFKATWRLAKIDDTTTELSLEVFLNPSIPMPDNLINGENLRGSVKGVKAMRARAERPAQSDAK